MVNLTLVEYHCTGNTTYSSSGNSLVFDPEPRNIKKGVSVKWRLRRPGYKKKIERGRFRYNEKITLTLTGSCSADKRDEIEWFAKRNSVFKIENLKMKTYHAEKTDDEPADTPSSWSAAKTQGEETVYLIFEKNSFTQAEAKVNFLDYVITLRRVSLTRH